MQGQYHSIWSSALPRSFVSKMARYVIDFQAFSIEKSFILKELTLAKLNSECVHHFLVKPPFDKGILSNSEFRQVSWLMKNYHMIDWDNNVFEYSDIFENRRIYIVRERFRESLIHWKGHEQIYYRFRSIELSTSNLPSKTKALKRYYM